MEKITRRQTIRRLGVGALALGGAASMLESTAPRALAQAQPAAPQLRFKSNGEFKLLVICDLHYNIERDDASLDMIGKWLDEEKPDLVIADGDLTTLNHETSTADDVKKVIGWIALRMEERGIPWGITFGNHDPEHSVSSGMTKERMIEVYATYPHNINKNPEKGMSGVGNQLTLIQDSKGARPVHALWLLDSGDCMSPTGQYQIHTDQVSWYYKASQALEKEHQGKIPGSMLFHIPVHEYIELVQTKKFVGAHGESECVPYVNSGILAAILERGDVKFICTGHDHVNNYIGNWRGVHLSYAGVSGFHAYPHTPPTDPSNDKCRCCRVFVLNENEPGTFKSWVRFKDNTLRVDNAQPDASVKQA